MDDVQPGKIMGRRRHVWEGHFRVAAETGGISVGVGDWGGGGVSHVAHVVNGGSDTQQNIEHREVLQSLRAVSLGKIRDCPCHMDAHGRAKAKIRAVEEVEAYSLGCEGPVGQAWYMNM
jgi:hypothetical protein